MMTNSEKFRTALGSALRDLRMKANLSQEELAERVHVHVNSLANYERGQGAIRAVLLFRICSVLNADVGRVFRQVRKVDC